MAAPKTQLFAMFPWIGGVNTSLEAALIPQNQLVTADNILMGINGSKRKRPGIDKNFDDALSNEDADEGMIGGGEFWYNSGGNRLQTFVTVNGVGAFRATDSDGSTTALTDAGIALSDPTRMTSSVIAGRFIMGFDGDGNTVKQYRGTGDVEDLLNKWEHTTLERGSDVGADPDTRRTIKLGESFKGVSGDYIVVENLGANYDGTYTVVGVSTTTLDNDTIKYDHVTPLTEAMTADTDGVVNGLAPEGEIVGQHQGRFLIIERGTARCHYSRTGDPEVWGGYDDSGVIDFGLDDNDPTGGTAIFPTFKGDLFLAKRTKLYRVRGVIPYHSIELVSDSLGAIHHNGVVAVDQSDVVFVSPKGVHSLVTTDSFGDYQDSYISKDIQTTFNEEWERRDYIKAAYIDSENLVAFGVTERDQAPTNNAVWFFSTNPDIRQWFRWPTLSCDALFTANDPDKKRLYIGGLTNRLWKTFADDRFDTEEAEDPDEPLTTAVTMRIKTGKIQIDNNPFFKKGFKRLVLYYTPRSNAAIQGTYRIDGFDTKAVSFNQAGGGTPLGVGFLLGHTQLGSEGVFGAYTRLIEGYGRSIQVELVEAGKLTSYSIEGLGVEYQPAGKADKVDQ